jgi:hypothetical protein
VIILEIMMSSILHPITANLSLEKRKSYIAPHLGSAEGAG